MGSRRRFSKNRAEYRRTFPSAPCFFVAGKRRAAHAYFIVQKALFLAVAMVVAIASTTQAQNADPAARQARAAQLRARGEAYMQSGDPGSAIGYFRDALAINPNDGRSYLALARIYEARGSTRDALEVLSVGLRHAPEDAALWGVVADVLISVGELDEAAQALREQTNRTPDDVEAYRRRAALAKQRGAWTEALASYRRVIDLVTCGNSSVDASVVDEARALVAGLVILAGGTDPVHAPASGCENPSAVRRALARCAER